MDEMISDDVEVFRAVLAPEFQRIFDYLVPYADDPLRAVLEVAIDYYPANALYGLNNLSWKLDVVIPEHLYVAAERVVHEDGPAEEYMLNSIRKYREEFYSFAA